MNTKLNTIQQVITDHYNIKYDWSLTLTYRSATHNVDKVGKDIKQLVDHLRRQVIGKSRLPYFNGKDHIMMFGSIERHANNSIHIHLNLTNPPEWLAKPEIPADLLKRIHKEALHFWENRKGHSVASSSSRATNHVQPLITQNESSAMLRYITKYTSQNNGNTFIAYWDSDNVVKPINCLR